MRIIKPYGRSVITERETETEGGLRVRLLAETNSNNKQAEPISALLEKDDFVLAQWLSVIDKIIQKAGEDENAAATKNPKAREKAEQHNRKNAEALELRQILGAEAWKVMTDTARSPHIIFSAPERAEKQRARWQEKLKTPNAKAKYRRNFPQGRWYQAFIGAAGENTLSAEEMRSKALQIAEKIHRHLYSAALAIGAPNAAKAKGKGAASHGVSSAAFNTLKRHDDKRGDDKSAAACFSEADFAEYNRKAGDVARRVKAAVLAKFAPRKPAAPVPPAPPPQPERIKVGGRYITVQPKPAPAPAAQKPQPADETVYILAVQELKLVWKNVFGAAETVAAAKSQNAALFAVHQAVKDGYKRLLKGRLLFPDKLKKDLPADKKQREGEKPRLIRQKLEEILPENSGALLCLIQRKSENRDINHLIRLGKIIHYQAAQDANAAEKKAANAAGGNAEIMPADSTAPAVSHFPASIEGSYFWSSAGQTEIKQNEALVRVWRRSLSFAARSLCDWAGFKSMDEKGEGVDILGEKGQQKACAEFAEKGNEKKFAALFGNEAALPKEASEQELLKYALKSVSALRNAVFHFKGLKPLLEALEREWKPKGRNPQKETAEQAEARIAAEKAVIKPLRAFARGLYGRGRELFFDVKRKELGAVKLHHYFGASDIRRFWAEITKQGEAAALLPLPRLKRALKRAEDAWKGADKLALPPYVSAQDREKEQGAADNCQFAALKMLYDSPFKIWLDELEAEKLNAYIGKAVARITESAKRLNGKGKTDAERDLIEARAAKLPKLQQGEKIENFFFNLTRATATEMRVQKGYESNGEQAKKQAEYIEELKCDVVAHAFAAYLQEQGLNFILRINEVKADKTRPKPYDSLQAPALAASEPWQEQLYCLLHLIPVPEISMLRQQIRKWEILIEKSAADKQAAQERAAAANTAQLIRVMDCYIAVHDAQFSGAAAENFVREGTKEFFEAEEDFEKVFKLQDGQKEPQAFRGLREMLRFGESALHPLYLRRKISAEAVKCWLWLEEEKTVVQNQRELKSLHESWARAKPKTAWVSEHGEVYDAVLQKVANHRHLTAQVMLQDHLRLYRLMMAVLARLIDFAGLFERDLYFTQLALLYKKRRADEKLRALPGKEFLKTQFDKNGLNKLKKGQIAAALRALQDEKLQGELKRLFNYDAVISIRNRFAHFAALEGEAPNINLTEEVNLARQLMSYDRKLKNAVSKSVIELLEREGLLLTWTMKNENGDHKLTAAKLEIKRAKHLGGAEIAQKEQGKVITRQNRQGREVPLKRKITEPLHSEYYCDMAADLFAGQCRRAR